MIDRIHVRPYLMNPTKMHVVSYVAMINRKAVDLCERWKELIVSETLILCDNG